MTAPIDWDEDDCCPHQQPPPGLTLRQALANLRAAERRYREALTGRTQCAVHWPFDPPGPGYLGTRCDLLAGHAEPHRCRVIGTSVTLDW